MGQRTATQVVRFQATLEKIDGVTIVRLPPASSAMLPSRGQVAVHGTINGRELKTVVEPDGSFGHWMKLETRVPEGAGIKPGDVATIAIEPVKEWPEPSLPKDFSAALGAAPEKIQRVWKDITPMARWEWVRWVNATRNPETRRRRVEVSMSKMNGGKRRPCCFDLSSCTDPELSQNGRLRASE